MLDRRLGRPLMLIKKDLIREARERCAGCGERFGQDLTLKELAFNDEHCAIDYKVPIKQGGAVEFGNVQVLCKPCFNGKNRAGLTDVEWRAQGCPQSRGNPKPSGSRRTGNLKLYRFR